MLNSHHLFSTLIRKRLPEGPTLLLFPDSTATITAIQVWLRAGSVSEGPQEEGLAHFLEHMIFKGSRRLGVGELAARVEASGGDINAYTMSDCTSYQLSCLPEKAEACLFYLIDSIWRPRLDEGEIIKERGVILAEIDRTMDQPDQVIQNHLFRRAYGKTHPYGRPIVGSRRSVSRIDRKSLRRFHRRCYNPSDSVIVISGNFSEKNIRAIIRKDLLVKRETAHSPKFGKKRTNSFMAPRPEGKGPRVVLKYGRSGLAHLEIAFSIPSFLDPDVPALEALAMILGRGESSRLYQRLCVKSSLMHDATADIFLSLGEGLFFLGGTADPECIAVSSNEIIQIMKEIVEHLPPTEEELNRVRLNFQSDLEFRKEILNRWSQMAGYTQLLTGNAHFVDIYMRRFMRVASSDIRKVAKKFFRPESVTAAALLPESLDESMVGKAFRKSIVNGFNPDPSKLYKKNISAQSSGMLKALPSIGKYIRRGRKEDQVFETSLPGGGRLVVFPCGNAGLLRLRAVFLGGQRLEGANWSGLHNFMGRVATQATRLISSEEMAGRIDGLAASMEGFSGRNSIGISASSLSAVSDELLELFSRVLTEPAFDKKDIDLAAREVLAERRSEGDDLSNLAHLRAMSILYQKHPFGRHPLGNLRILKKMNTRNLRLAWRRWITPSNLVLVIAGDVDPVGMTEKIKKLLRRWVKHARHVSLPRPPPPPVPPVRGRHRRYIVESATQSHIYLSFLGVNFHDPRRYVLSVLTAALDSQGGSLFFELRERRGLVYAVHITSEEALDSGPISFYAATSPEMEGEVLSIMHQEIQRVIKKGLDPEEIERAKAYLIGEHLRSHQSSGAKASSLAFDLLYGLEPEGPEDFRRNIEAVQAEDIQKVAEELLSPGRECVVTLGPPLKNQRAAKRSRK